MDGLRDSTITFYVEWLEEAQPDRCRPVKVGNEPGGPVVKINFPDIAARNTLAASAE